MLLGRAQTRGVCQQGTREAKVSVPKGPGGVRGVGAPRACASSGASIIAHQVEGVRQNNGDHKGSTRTPGIEYLIGERAIFQQLQSIPTVSEENKTLHIAHAHSLPLHYIMNVGLAD